MLNFYRSLLGALSFLLLCSCASISTLQTAETTDKGTFDHTFAVGQITADVDAVSGIEVDSGDVNETSISLPMVEYMLRYGISDSFDIGLRTTGFVHGLDVKWNFLDAGSFLMSAGVGGSYLSYTVSNGVTETDVTAIDIVPAIFMDLVTSEKTRFYLVPKLVRRSVSITDQPDEDINYMGGSLGFKWGNSLGVFVEYTLLQGSYTPTGSTTENDVDLNQLAFGFFF